jgi:hypothetical protein
LQSALSAASNGDEIWVAAGMYKPTTGTDRTISFTLRSGVAIYGGFAGTETLRSQRDLSANVTVLSGDINNNDSQIPIITDLTTVTGNSDNSYHVVTGTNTSTLDGFTITAGYADGGFPYNSGSGLYNDGVSPTLTNINFSGNFATNSGGGMRNDFGSPTLTNVAFDGNSAGSGGGMINVSGSSPTLTNVIFSNNWTASDGNGGGMVNHTNSSPALMNVTFNNNSADYGGGMFNTTSSNPTLTNVTFISNFAGLQGGGMANVFNSSPILTNVSFSSNSATNGGGMRNFYNSSPMLTNVTFSGNSAAYGGGMENNSNSNPALTNVTFSANSASYGGGMVNISTSSATLTNATFSGNAATSSGGGMYINNDSPNSQIRNTIFWGNTANADGTQIQNNSGTLNVSDSVVQDGCPVGSTCTNIITADPMLGILGNYGGSTQTVPLSAGSSAIDRGNALYCPVTDQRGMVRPQGPICDIGAFEYYDGTITPGETIRVSVSSFGAQANSGSFNQSISADGRYVAFASPASNLVPGDTNGVYDVFVRDMLMGLTTRISVDSNGTQGQEGSYDPSISADGNYVAFQSAAANLGPVVRIELMIYICTRNANRPYDIDFG